MVDKIYTLTKETDALKMIKENAYGVNKGR